MRLCEILTSGYLIDGVTDTTRRDKACDDATVGKVGRERLMYVNRELTDVHADLPLMAPDTSRFSRLELTQINHVFPQSYTLNFGYPECGSARGGGT